MTGFAEKAISAANKADSAAMAQAQAQVDQTKMLAVAAVERQQKAFDLHYSMDEIDGSVSAANPYSTRGSLWVEDDLRLAWRYTREKDVEWALHWGRLSAHKQNGSQPVQGLVDVGRLLNEWGYNT